MSFFFRSLFGRNLLLLLLLFAFNWVCGLWILRELVQKPRVAEFADLAARQVRSLQEVLQAVPAVQQSQWLRRLNSGEELRVVPADSISAPAQPLPQTLFAHLFLDAFMRRLRPNPSDVQWSGEDQGTLWVRISLADTAYWLIVPGIQSETYPPVAIELVVLMAVLSVLGAVLIQRRINLPLSRLVRAANQIANGEVVQPVSERAPTEIAMVARAFNHMSTSLAHVDTERSVMLAGVSHDLRTPLAKMRIAIELLSRDGEPTLIESMLRSAAELDAIIDQFIEFSRVAGIGEKRSVDLNRLVRERAASFRACGRTLQLDLQDLPPLALHLQSISRAIDNLIENAVRYAGPEVLLRSRCQDGMVQLSVLDRGPGIPPNHIERLRKPFTRGDSSAGTSGAGLGLAIVDHIARKHGGKFVLLPREGGGLHARMDLPVALNAVSLDGGPHQ